MMKFRSQDGDGRIAIFVFDEAANGSSAFSAPPVPVIRVDPSADASAIGSGVQEQTEALVNAINKSYLKIHGTTESKVVGGTLQTRITLHQQIKGDAGLTVARGDYKEWKNFFPPSEVIFQYDGHALAAFKFKNIPEYNYVPPSKPAIVKDGWIIAPTAVGKKYVMDVVIKNTDIPSLWEHNKSGYPTTKTQPQADGFTNPNKLINNTRNFC